MSQVSIGHREVQSNFRGCIQWKQTKRLSARLQDATGLANNRKASPLDDRVFRVRKCHQFSGDERYQSRGGGRLVRGQNRTYSAAHVHWMVIRRLFRRTDFSHIQTHSDTHAMLKSAKDEGSGTACTNGPSNSTKKPSAGPEKLRESFQLQRGPLPKSLRQM